ncbi:MAG: transcriptional regulator [Gammaproteobacteria bacterium]|nr:transcriptional regulator [Gammaproteobacteria bacterium]
MVEPREILAANLKRLRNATGLSQEALADRAGLHRTYISSVERGRRNVTLDNIFALAAALDVEASELLRSIEDGDL